MRDAHSADAQPMNTPHEPEPGPERVHLHMPVDVRSASLVVIALLASVFMLRWASAVFIPLLLGLMFSYALSPAVDRLQRWHVPRAIGGAALMIALLGGVGSMAYSLSDDAAALIESLPDAAQKLRMALRAKSGAPEGTIDKVQKAATQLEQAAEESSSRPSTTTNGVTRVQIERARFNVHDYLWNSTLGLGGFIGQALVVCFITYFLLATGDSFRRKMVRIAGPRFSQKKVTIQALDEITEQIQRYLMVLLVTSVLVGVATWLALLWIGLEHAAVWGIAAAVLNLVPYIGSIVTSSGVALVGFLQFGTFGTAILIGGASMVIHTISGYLLTPWLTSRVGRMNPVAIFVGVLAMGWLWGIWGLLLGVPLLTAVKAVCDRVDDLKPIGELLGA